jgi:hypothetical protein
MQRRAIRYGAAVASATIAAIYCAISARPGHLDPKRNAPR